MGNCVSVKLLLGVGAMGNCVSVKLLLGWELWVTVSQASCCWGGGCG